MKRCNPTIFKIRLWPRIGIDFDVVLAIVEYGVLYKNCGVLYGQFRQKSHAERIGMLIKKNAPCELPSFI